MSTRARKITALDVTRMEENGIAREIYSLLLREYKREEESVFKEESVKEE